MNAILVAGTAPRNMSLNSFVTADGGDLIADHLDTGALLRLIEGGVPAALPFVPPGAP